MKTLLHICCGPCSIYPVDRLREQGFDVQGYYFNPNIHPFTEYGRRQETLAAYAKSIELPVFFADEYPVEEYFRQVAFREHERCRLCYTMRLREAAGKAKEAGFDQFTTTLLVSPYQKHELIRDVGEAAATEYGIPFHYEDFRVGYRDATARSRQLEMYRQKYCGCVFSERERFDPKRKRVKPNRGNAK